MELDIKSRSILSTIVRYTGPGCALETCKINSIVMGVTPIKH